MEIMAHQMPEDGDIAVAQLLSMAATQYAGAIITATVGAPAPETSVLEALGRARQALATVDHVPTSVRESLRDLQMAAVFFTVQLAISEGHGAPENLRRIEDQLVAVLNHGTARLHRHDGSSAIQYFGDRALDYMHQIICAEDDQVPIGSNAMWRSLTELQVAATTFTTRLAVVEGHDAAPLGRLEEKLTTVIANFKNAK